jgi:hypothetical protein
MTGPPARQRPIPDAALVGIFTGAGISSGPPACLPLGRTFHRLLREACEMGARSFAPDVVDDRVIMAARRGSWNPLARIENTLPGAGSGAIRAMRIRVPNEEHLLAAIHLARGGYHVTVNFDDGVEVAYALLAGDRPLPGASAETVGRLRAWRRSFPAAAPSLRVLSRPADLDARAFRSRPLLVKLHGSLGEHPDGVALSLPGVTDEPEVVDLGRARHAALEELSRHPIVLVTGFSGGDPASTTPIVDRLRRTRFEWVAPEVRPAIRSVLEAIDPSQPRLGLAADALREILGVDPPAWTEPSSGPSFEQRFTGWLGTMPPTVTAEAYAWLLSDAGLLDEAIELLDRIARVDRRARTRLRLADALTRRGGHGDRPRARRQIWTLIATGDRDVRRCAIVRWAEQAVVRADPSGCSGADSALPAAIAARLSVAAGWRAAPPARIRSTVVLASIVLDRLERELQQALDAPTRRAALLRTTTRTMRAVRVALSGSAATPSGRRRTELRRQALELRAIAAIVRRRSLPRSALVALDEVAEAFAHLSDQRGAADTLATRALVSSCRGDVAAAEAALAQAVRLGASRALLDMVAAATAARTNVGGAQSDGGWVASAGISSTTASSTSSSTPSRTSSSAP